jgi:23S rRNA pseudouridine1911/1915/1917 synthase
MAYIKHPLLGDSIYGPDKTPAFLVKAGGRREEPILQGQCLHARILGFVHPRTGDYMEFEAPLPEYFRSILEKCSLQKPGHMID